MKDRVPLVVALVLILASVFMMGPRETARVQGAGYSGFPTLIEDDGKFLCIVGLGQQTFANRPIRMWIGVESL